MVGKEEKKLLFIQTREKLFYLDLGIEVNSWDPISVISVKSLSRVWLFATPWTVALPGSSVHGIFQVIVLEWIALSFSRGSSRHRDRTQVSCIAGRGFNLWSTRDLIRCLQIGCTGDHLSSMEFWELAKKMVVEHDQWHWEQTMPFSKFHIKHAYDATIHITCFSEGFEVSLNMAIAIIMKW